MTNKLLRETSSNALLNSDSQSFDEYKFKKKVIRDINSLIDAVKNMQNKIDSLEEEIIELKSKKGEN